MVFKTVFVPLQAYATNGKQGHTIENAPSQKKARAKATDQLSEEKKDKATFLLEDEVVSSTEHE
jgi:hypothetical protein